MNKTNQIIFTKSRFPTDDALYGAVGNTIINLIKSGYIIVGSCIDAASSYVIVNYAMNDMNSPKPYWLFTDEVDYLFSFHEQLEYEMNKAAVEEFEEVNDVAFPDKKDNKFDA